MRSLLRVAAVLSSMTLLVCGVWLAQMQAHGQAPAMPGSKSGILRVPMGEVLQPPPMVMSGSKSFSGTVIKGDLLLRQDLWSIGKKNDAPQAVQGASRVSSVQSGVPPAYSLDASGGNAVWLKFSLFQGEVSMPDLLPVDRFDIQPRVSATTGVKSALSANVEGVQTLLGMSVRPFGWHELLPDYSDLTKEFLPALGRWSMPLEQGHVGSSIYSSMSGRMRAWLSTGLAEDFRQLTQDGHPDRQILLAPFMFKNGIP